jgi:hypothetical protein
VIWPPRAPGNGKPVTSASPAGPLALGADDMPF